MRPMSNEFPPKEGWGFLRQTRKLHYFEPSGESLCGHWFMLFDNLVEARDDAPSNCAACRRRLKARQEAAK